jgi:hypothetical protein
MLNRRSDTERHYNPNWRDKLLRWLTPGFGDENPDDRWWTKLRKLVLGWLITLPMFLVSCYWERIFHRKRFKQNAGR